MSLVPKLFPIRYKAIRSSRTVAILRLRLLGGAVAPFIGRLPVRLSAFNAIRPRRLLLLAAKGRPLPSSEGLQLAEVVPSRDPGRTAEVEEVTSSMRPDMVPTCLKGPLIPTCRPCELLPRFSLTCSFAASQLAVL